jgi:hypothetical protein
MLGLLIPYDWAEGRTAALLSVSLPHFHWPDLHDGLFFSETGSDPVEENWRMKDWGFDLELCEENGSEDGEVGKCLGRQMRFWFKEFGGKGK